MSKRCPLFCYDEFVGATTLAELGLPLAAFLIGAFTFISAQRDLGRKVSKEELRDLEERLKEAGTERERLRVELAEMQFANYRLFQKIDALEQKQEAKK